MAQWGKNDAASNSVVWAPAQLNKEPSRANANALFGNTTSGAYITGATHATVGVDEYETREGGIAHAGWQLKTTGSGGRAGRVTYETLVALSSMIGDTADNLDNNYFVVITTQPTDAFEDASDPATFTVVAASDPTGDTLAYQWQLDSGSGFANIAEASVYSDVDTDTLTISDVTGLDGNLYRVVITASTGGTATSAAATLTVS